MAGSGKIVFKSDVSGLKNASKELLKMAENANRTGASLAYADKEELNFIRSLGSMQTTAKSVSGRMSELSTTIKELSIHYRELSDEAKKSPYGKELQSTIGQLQGRFRDLKVGVDEAAKGMQTSGGIADRLSTIFGGASGTLLKLTGIAGGAVGAFQSFNQVMRASQTTSDLYDQVQRGLNNSLSIFSTALATADFSIMSQGLTNIMNKAAATQAIFDQLGNALISLGVVENDANLKINRARAVLYDPEATKEDKAKAMKEIKSANAELKAAAAVVAKDTQKYIKSFTSEKSLLNANDVSMGAVRKIVKLDATQGRDSTKAVYEKQYKEFLNKKAELDKKYAKPKQYNTAMGMSFSNGQVAGGELTAKEYDSALTSLTKKYSEALLYQEILRKNDDERLKTLVQYVNKYTQLNEMSRSGIMGTGGRTISRLNNQLNGGGTSSAKTNSKKVTYDNSLYAGDWEGLGNGAMVPFSTTATPSLSSASSTIKSLQRQMQLTTSPEAAYQYSQQISGLQTYSNRFASGNMDSNGIYNPLQGKSSLVEPVLTPENKQLDEEERKKRRKGGTATDGAGMALESIGRMGSGIEDLVQIVGGEVPEGLGKTIETIMTLSSIFQSFMMIYQTWEILKKTLLVWIFGAVSTDALIPLAKGGYIPQFAGGGTMGGSSFSGDHLLARLNSGEVVLNSQQSGNILYQLAQSKNGNGGGGSSYVSGEKIFLGVNNYLKRTGKGEIVTTR